MSTPGRMWVVYKSGHTEPGTFIGVFTEEHLARLAAHHPYDPSQVHEVQTNVAYEGFPGEAH